MIGVSKTFGGSSILSSPAIENAEKSYNYDFPAFFVCVTVKINPLLCRGREDL